MSATQSANSTTLSFNTQLGVHTNLTGTDIPLKDGEPIHFRFSVFSEDPQSAVIRTLDRFLLGLDLIFVRDSVLGSLRELITNAIKANAKRLFFESNQADITNQTSYDSLMKRFKQEYLSNRLTFDKNLINSKYSIITTFAFNKQVLRLRVMNNISLTQDELARIQDKINKADKYNDLGEAIMEAGDDTEGAGLGLIMTTMMLKNDGIPVSSLKYDSKDNKTSVIIDIPISIGVKNPQLDKADKLLREIDHLPTFPKTIQDIQASIDKPNSSIAEIGGMIKKDISLSASVLKLANSAAYRRGNRVESLDRAIQLIGLKELQTLLYSLGTKQIMEDKFPAFNEIWERSNESAFYAKLIGKKMNLNKEQQNNLVSAALLHDIGEIVLLSLEKDKMGGIQSLSQSKELSSTLSLEESAFGITHTKLGAMIAEKWFFPEVFSVAMEYHHKPLQSPEGYQDIIYPIYLADMMIRINYNEARPTEIPEKVLTVCGFRSLSELQSFRTKALEDFNNS